MKPFSIRDSKVKNATFRKSSSIKMYKFFFILWIWINLFGEVKPVKPIFDLANNMRLVSFSNSIKKPHSSHDLSETSLDFWWLRSHWWARIAVTCNPNRSVRPHITIKINKFIDETRRNKKVNKNENVKKYISGFAAIRHQPGNNNLQTESSRCRRKLPSQFHSLR